jgi:hypothetical protein
MDHHPTGLSEEEFLRANKRSLAALRQIHPDRNDADLAHALGQAMGLTEPAGHVRLMEAASLLLESE